MDILNTTQRTAWIDDFREQLSPPRSAITSSDFDSHPLCHFLRNALGESFDRILTDERVSALIATTLSVAPMSMKNDPFNIIGSRFDPDFQSVNLTSFLNKKEEAVTAIMILHDSAHLLRGSVAPYTMRELEEAKKRLLHNDIAFRPVINPETIKQEALKYSLSVMEREVDAYYTSHVLIASLIGDVELKKLVGDDWFNPAEKLGNSGIPYERWPEVVRAYYLHSLYENLYQKESEEMIAHQELMDLCPALTPIAERGKIDAYLAEMLFIRLRDTQDPPPWMFLFLGRCAAYDAPIPHVSTPHVHALADPYHHSAVGTFMTSYIDLKFRNTDILRTLDKSNNGKAARRRYLRLQSAIDECNQTLASEEAPPEDPKSLFQKALRLEGVLPVTLPTLVKEQYPFVGLDRLRSGNLAAPIEIGFGFAYNYIKLAREGFLHQGSSIKTIMEDLFERNYVPRKTAEFSELPKQIALSSVSPFVPDESFLVSYAYNFLGDERAEEKNYEGLSPDQKIAVLDKAMASFLLDVAFLPSLKKFKETPFVFSHTESLNGILGLGGSFIDERSLLEVELSTAREMARLFRFATFGTADERTTELTQLFASHGYSTNVGYQLLRFVWGYGFHPEDAYYNFQPFFDDSFDPSVLTDTFCEKLMKLFIQKDELDPNPKLMAERMNNPEFLRALTNATFLFGNFGTAGVIPSSIGFRYPTFHKKTGKIFRELRDFAINELTTALSFNSSVNLWRSATGGNFSDELFGHLSTNIEELAQLAFSASGGAGRLVQVTGVDCNLEPIDANMLATIHFRGELLLHSLTEGSQQRRQKLALFEEMQLYGMKNPRDTQDRFGGRLPTSKSSGDPRTDAMIKMAESLGMNVTHVGNLPIEGPGGANLRPLQDILRTEGMSISRTILDRTKKETFKWRYVGEKKPE